MPDSSSQYSPQNSSTDDLLRNGMRSRSYKQRDFIKPVRPVYFSEFTRPLATKPQSVVNKIPQPIDKVAVYTAPELKITRPPVIVEQQTEPTFAPTIPIEQPAYKLNIRSEQQLPNQLKVKKVRSNRLVPKLLVGMAVFVFVIGIYVSFIGFRADQASKVQAANLTKAANKASNSTTGQVLSTNKPSADDLANYVVAPNMPRYLIISKLGVDSRIKPLGVSDSDQLQAPTNVYDTGWYNASSLPGQPGAMLIDGHVSSWTAHGVFYGIKTLVAGDQIKVIRGDGTTFTYTVVKSQIYNANQVDMQAAITPVIAGKPGLNLMTCTGDVIAGTSEFNERIIVFASLN